MPTPSTPAVSKQAPEKPVESTEEPVSSNLSATEPEQGPEQVSIGALVVRKFPSGEAETLREPRIPDELVRQTKESVQEGGWNQF
jgi:hypothetical protein